MRLAAALCVFCFSFAMLFLTEFIEKYFRHEKSSLQGAFCFELFSFPRFYANASAQHFRIGIGGFPQESLIVGTDGEEGRVHARKLPRIFEDLVSAEVYNHVHLFVEIIRNLFFDGCDVVFLLYHRLMIDKAEGIYTC